MDDLFEWAKDNPLAIIIYYGLIYGAFKEALPWAGPHPSWLIIIGMLVAASVVAAVGTLVIGWALRLGWRMLLIAWLVVRLLPAALRGLVLVTLGALVWLGELGRPPNWPRREAQKSSMRQELQILSAKRRHETFAFAKSMLAGIEANRLGSGEIELLAEMLSRPGRPVSGQKGEVIGALRCLLNDPDYLRPHFHSLESEWLYEKQAAEIVRPSEQVKPP